MLVKILVGAFYAQKNVRTPVRIAVMTIVVNMILNLILMSFYAHVGLALATALSAFFNGMCLLFMLWYRGHYSPLAGWWRFALQLGIALVLMLAFLIWGMGDINDWLTSVWWEKLSYLLGLIGGAITIYFATLHLCGLRLKQMLTPQKVEEA
jgi:putative peptidoglycan lipid II flippase